MTIESELEELAATKEAIRTAFGAPEPRLLVSTADNLLARLIEDDRVLRSLFPANKKGRYAPSPITPSASFLYSPTPCHATCSTR